MHAAVTTFAVVASLVLLPVPAGAADSPGLARPLVAEAAASPASVGAAVAVPFSASALGKNVSVTVIDAATGALVFHQAGTQAVLPASTLKLVTALTALTVLPPEETLTTRLVSSGRVDLGVLEGDLVIVGGGDPTLSSLDTPSYPAPARMSGLVDALRRKGITAIRGGIVVDTSAYDGPRLEASWKPTYVTEGSAAPVVALMVDGGRSRAGATRGARSATPEILAGQRLSAMLKAAGISVGGGVSRGVAAAGAVELGVVHSAPVPALVERMLLRSDNDLAEALSRSAARVRGLPASFAGGAQVATETLTRLGVPMAGVLVRDGSGLSRGNRVTTDLLAAALRLATAGDHPELRPLLSGLPTAGFNGTLLGRYRDQATRAAAGRVRAKTGSLNNVTTLAGVVVTRSGQLLVFAASADHVPTASTTAAARTLDRAVAVLEACGCN
ncbi:MAG: D-alanyl-D-alanine carboxypeptidase/D-alanyl-D-alanine-endopeptidase [Mycobacteriales bacterium]